MKFNPNDAANDHDGIFGLPFQKKDSELILFSVPWEATTSYGGGTSGGPEAILKASHQVDLFHPTVNKPYEPGIYFHEIDSQIKEWNKTAKASAETYRKTKKDSEKNKVNQLSQQINQKVKNTTLDLLKNGHGVGLIGGDHSTPYGFIEALGEIYNHFGILHIDAHSDTRKSYEGFTHSHASIMYNVLENISSVTQITQVGIRDFCEEEWDYNQTRNVSSFFDHELKKNKYKGLSWLNQCQQIIQTLPENVYISFDIDGLDPKLCPSTGTPVPGGLEFQEASFLIEQIAKTKKIIGFDLNEVCPHPENEWDANVGARMLYSLCAYFFASQKKCDWN